MTPESIVYLNGVFVPLGEARISVLDRGFLFGDGVYEVVPVYEGVPFRWRQHYARLKRSLAALRLVNPYDTTTWDHLVGELIARHPWTNQCIYLQLTRGVAPRDHAFPKDSHPTVFGMSQPFAALPEAWLHEGVAAISWPDERWTHCHIKSTALLGNVLAKQAAVDAGAAECLMFRDYHLTEGSASNIWVVHQGAVWGVLPDHHVLEGIRFGLLEELCAAEGIKLTLQPIPRAMVAQADELMLSSATKELLPITRLDGQPVGHGKPGPVFERLYARYQQAKAQQVAQPWRHHD
jgi:D-alanine transaminase